MLAEVLGVERVAEAAGEELAVGVALGRGARPRHLAHPRQPRRPQPPLAGVVVAPGRLGEPRHPRRLRGLLPRRRDGRRRRRPPAVVVAERRREIAHRARHAPLPFDIGELLGDVVLAVLADPLPRQPVADAEGHEPAIGGARPQRLAVVDLEHGELRVLADAEADLGDRPALPPELGGDDDVRALVDLLDRRLDDLGVEVLEGLVVGRVVDPHQLAEEPDLPPAGAPGAQEAIAVLVERQRVPRGEAPLDVEVDEREDLGVVELLGERRRIGVLAHPLLELGVGEQRRDPPLLPAARVEHVPLGHGLGEAAERRLQRLHVVRVVADHQAQRPRVDPVRRLRQQVVVSVEQQHVRELALQERQLARDVDRRDVLLDRAAPERSAHALARDLLESAHRSLPMSSRSFSVTLADQAPAGKSGAGTSEIRPPSPAPAARRARPVSGSLSPDRPPRPSRKRVPRARHHPRSRRSEAAFRLRTGSRRPFPARFRPSRESVPPVPGIGTSRPANGFLSSRNRVPIVLLTGTDRTITF